MPLGDPIIHAECDKCGEISDPMRLTALARRGEYDERSVPGQLKKMEWQIDGDKTFCPDCKSE